MTTDVEVEELLRDYQSAFNSGDAATVATFYTEDAVIMPPTGPLRVVGKDEVLAFYTETFRHMTPQLSDYTSEYRIANDTLIVIESWKVTLATEDAQKAASGQGMWAARKGSDGGWRVFWSIAKFIDPPAEVQE